MTAYQVPNASSFVCVVDEDDENKQPSYRGDGDNYPIAPITPTGNHDHTHDRDNR